MEHVVYLSFCQSQPIDYAILKKNVSAIMIRTGQGTWEDTLFRLHYDNVLRSGIPFGLWHFNQPNQPADPQVEAFLKIYNSLPFKPPVIAFDDEDINYIDRVTGQRVLVVPPSREYHHANLLKMCRTTTEETKGKVGIYTRKNYFEEWTFESSEWYKYWMWIAAWYNYTGQVAPALPWKWPTYKIHQYEGGTGRIEGITGPVCREYFNGSHSDLLNFYGFEESAPGGETGGSEEGSELAGRVQTLETWARSFPK